jgi:ubiquinone/menaquinone biosynthesis C-methylase UbiE
MAGKIIIERIPGIFAGLYEKAGRMVKESYYRVLAEEISGLLVEGSILDLGTGPGFLPIEIAKLSPGITIMGLDLSSELLKMAEKKAYAAGVSDRVHFRLGSAALVPFEDNRFDLVLSTGMLHMVKDPLKVFQEIHRVLKPGGQALILDPARVSSGIDKKKWKASLTGKEKIMLRVFHLFSRIHPGRSYHQAELEEILARTEFREKQVEEQGKEIKILLRKTPGFK